MTFRHFWHFRRTPAPACVQAARGMHSAVRGATSAISASALPPLGRHRRFSIDQNRSHGGAGPYSRGYEPEMNSPCYFHVILTWPPARLMWDRGPPIAEVTPRLEVRG